MLRYKSPLKIPVEIGVCLIMVINWFRKGDFYPHLLYKFADDVISEG